MRINLRDTKLQIFTIQKLEEDEEEEERVVKIPPSESSYRFDVGAVCVCTHACVLATVVGNVDELGHGLSIFIFISENFISFFFCMFLFSRR